METKFLFKDARAFELVVAAESGDIDKIDALVKDGVDVNVKGMHDVTPVLRSMLAKNRKGYLALLKHGANPNALDQNGLAAMNLAAREEDSIWLREALKYRGDSNLVNKGSRFRPNETPLFFAIDEDRPENVRLLVDAGADVNHKSDKWATPLNMATNRSYEIVYILIESGARYDASVDDIIERLRIVHRNGLFNRSEKEKEWFSKVKVMLEKKGVSFADAGKEGK